MALGMIGRREGASSIAGNRHRCIAFLLIHKIEALAPPPCAADLRFR